MLALLVLDNIALGNCPWCQDIKDHISCSVPLWVFHPARPQCQEAFIAPSSDRMDISEAHFALASLLNCWVNLISSILLVNDRGDDSGWKPVLFLCTVLKFGIWFRRPCCRENPPSMRLERRETLAQLWLSGLRIQRTLKYLILKLIYLIQDSY